jgi:hypothetical protein
MDWFSLEYFLYPRPRDEDAVMKWIVSILMVFFSLVAWCHPRDSARMAEKKKAKIERQKQRIMQKWDQRTMQQKKNDRRVLLFMAISTGILVNSIARKE